MFGWQLRLGLHTGAGAFDPRSLFRNGEQGWWFDNSRLDTLFQDAAGTIQVTGAGQPVGLQLDLSGRGNHRLQPTPAARPTLRFNATTGAYYLETDGSDDWMSTNNINFTGTDKVTLFTGVRKLSDAAQAVIAELSATSFSTNGSFAIIGPQAAVANNYLFRSRGGSTAEATTPGAYASPVTSVISAEGNISADSVVLRVNGTHVAQSTVDQGTGTYGNYPAYFFRRGGTTLPFNGHEYSSICVGRLCTAAETGAIERLLAQRTGVQLA